MIEMMFPKIPKIPKIRSRIPSIHSLASFLNSLYSSILSWHFSVSTEFVSSNNVSIGFIVEVMTFEIDIEINDK